MQILSNDGKTVIHNWTTDGSEKSFSIDVGEYIFREIKAPQGYDKVSDVQFSVEKDSKITLNWTTDGSEKSFSIDVGEYIFREIKAPQGYDKVSDVQFSVEKDSKITLKTQLDYVKIEGNKLIVTDNVEVPKVTRSVEKKWRDKGFEHERPSSVSIQLYADDKPYRDPVTLNDANSWKHDWNDLPKVSESGQEIKYTVQEVEIPGKEIGIDYIPSYENKGDTFTVTNIKGLEMVISKEVEIKYTVQEVEIPGKEIGIDYIPSYENKGDTFTVTNIKGLEMVISKEVIGNGGDKSKEFTFEIELNFMGVLTHKDQIKYEGSVLNGYENEVEAPKDGTLNFDPVTMKAKIELNFMGVLTHKDQIKYEGSVLNGYENEVEAPKDGTLNFDPVTMKARIKLKHGQQVTLKNILYTPNLMYTVKELEGNQDGYKTTYNDADTPATGECIDHIVVRVKNTKEGTPPPTGIVENHKGTGVLIGMSMLGLLLVIIGYISRLRKGIKQ